MVKECLKVILEVWVIVVFLLIDYGNLIVNSVVYRVFRKLYLYVIFVLFEFFL